MESESPKKQVRNLLIVLFSGLLAAFLLAGAMLYQYGPSGRYLISNILLSPDILPTLNYNAYDPKTNGTSRFVFDKIEFASFNPTTGKLQTQPIDNATYAKFYALVANEKSLADVKEPMINRFAKPQSARLLIHVRTESSAKWQATTKVFQEIEFENKGDYFRVEIHEDSKQTQWAYFYYPKIYTKIYHLFTSGQTN